MGDRMETMSFEKMLMWIMKELKTKDTIFGIHREKFYEKATKDLIPFLGESLGTPIGPAAGPHSQLTQNIVAAYLCGSRFIELKTVQTLDGEDLPVSKPCIRAEDECYNVEWSTELRVQDAFEEYVKGWFLLHFLQKELGLSEKRDFIFNMSVGYDLEGIKSEKIDNYIEGLKDATSTRIWKECREVLEAHLDEFSIFTKRDIEEISPHVCSSITLSTLHGCPPEEIERIATYLLKEKHLNTFIKMNPTLLGEEFVRNTFDEMGYDYITLNPHHFKHDLQYGDGVSMVRRLKLLAREENLGLGVKLTNTLPVKILNKELPGEEMYMSGRSLFPLTINLAKRLSKEFNGELIISYSGGADYFNVKDIFETGICPITVATTALKPGGYERMTQLATTVEPLLKEKKELIDLKSLEALAEGSFKNKHHLKNARPVNSRKLKTSLKTYDCSVAPCREGCPIHQQIPEYVDLVAQGRYEDAFKVIAIDNACPSITGTICNHNCESKCTRLDYDSSVEIRELKKVAALKAENAFTKTVVPSEIKTKKKALVVGAGPAGLGTALYLRRNGMEVQVIEKLHRPFGVVGNIIPDFRISKEDIARDFQMIINQGVHVNFGVKEELNIQELKKKYDYIVLAIGAWKEMSLALREGNEKVINALTFLEKYRGDVGNLGCHVCVIGGGNVAMDTARASKRVKGVEKVSIIYRRTKAQMPADEEEIREALEEGIILEELLAPVSFEGNVLICEKMTLGEADSSGRRSPLPTGEMVNLPASTVIAAVGEKVDDGFLRDLGIEISPKGQPIVKDSGETNIQGVYIAGDARTGAATIVEAMAGGKKAAFDILSKENLSCDFDREEKEKPRDNMKFINRKGILAKAVKGKEDGERCLSCSKVCQLCVDVCPNRANMVFEVGDELDHKYEILHIDGMCNECGNCGIFCPHDGNPYKDKATLFWSEGSLLDSENIGFFIENKDTGACVVRNEEKEIIKCFLHDGVLSKEMSTLIGKVIKEGAYLIEGEVKSYAISR